MENESANSINDNELKKLSFDRFNATDYISEIKGTYAMLPDHIMEKILSIKPDSLRNTCIVVYVILYLDVSAYNNSELAERAKCKKFFGLTDQPAKKALDTLEELGLIVQKKVKQNKKVITMKYPEYINHINGATIEYSKETLTYTKENLRISDNEQLQQSSKVIEINPNINNKDVDVNSDIKTSNYLDNYIEWNNSFPNKKPILNPAGFKKVYRKNPNSIDFTDYEKFLKEKAYRKKNKKIESKLNQEQRELEKIQRQKDKEDYEYKLSVLQKLKAENHTLFTHLENNLPEWLRKKDITFIAKTIALFNLYNQKSNNK